MCPARTFVHESLSYVIADDPKSESYSENEGWEFVSLGDQVSATISFLGCLLNPLKT